MAWDLHINRTPIQNIINRSFAVFAPFAVRCLYLKPRRTQSTQRNKNLPTRNVTVSYLLRGLFIIFWYEKTTERTEDTENYCNSVISASSVVDYPYLSYLSGEVKKSQFLSEFISDQKKLKSILLSMLFKSMLPVWIIIIIQIVNYFMT